jgi:hypothetical protein
VIDALISQIEQARSEGALVILKWDVGATLAEALSAYRAAHARAAYPSIERTCSSGLRPLPHAAHVKR